MHDPVNVKFERPCSFVTAVGGALPCNVLAAVLCSKQWWEARPAADM